MRIPLIDMIDALTTSEGEGYDLVVLPGPVYFTEVDGEINAVYGISPLVPMTLPEDVFRQSLRKHKIPKTWRNRPWNGS